MMDIYNLCRFYGRLAEDKVPNGADREVKMLTAAAAELLQLVAHLTV